MTSRLSIELVQKAVRMQLPWLVGMSAPTSTAVRVAERYGLGLAGFLRDDRVTYYSRY
jgi:FdhD protein